MADYAQGHTLVLSSSMANETHIPGLIRGHEGTIMMVPNGQFEGKVDPSQSRLRASRSSSFRTSMARPK